AARPPGRTLFPYTTLFRSEGGEQALVLGQLHQPAAGGRQRVEREQHDLAPPIVLERARRRGADGEREVGRDQPRPVGVDRGAERSEEHTSELQSRENLVCR